MPTGTATWYDLTVGRKLDYEDMLYLLTAVEVPLLGTYNDPNKAPSAMRPGILPKGSASQVKVEWSEEELNTSDSTVDDNPLTTAATTLNVPAGDGVRFQKGHVIRAAAEHMRVTAVATDALTVTRAFASTTAVQHAQNTKIFVVGTALAEGSDPETNRFKDRDGKHNFTQIFGPYEIKVSGTKQVTPIYGVPKEADHQILNQLKVLAIEIERSIIYGQRSDDTTNEFRTMGGLDFFITTNKDSTTTDLTEAKLLDQFQNCYDSGGAPDIIAAGATQKRKVSGFNAPVVRVERGDETVGRVVTRYESDFAVADVVLHRYVQKANLFLWEREDSALLTLRPIVREPLAKTGDSDKWQILCEKTFKLRRQKRAAKFTALA